MFGRASQEGLFALFRDEEGLTTTSVALAMLLSLALVFSAAQVYRVNSLSAEVQDVADAAALAAENQVAKFMLIARTCDAVVLSMTLTGIVATGLGAVAACVPSGASVSAKLIRAGSEILKARTKFAEKASSGLNDAMKALPLISAAQAMNVARSNSGSSNSSYLAIALLVDSEGEQIEIETDDSADEFNDDVSDEADEVKEKAAQAEEKAQEANAVKTRAFMHDCGNNPSYCMYERASTLAGMSGSSNPLYSSVDAWSFSVALNRAKAYYANRLANEEPLDSSVAEGARSALRKRFYSYACSQMSEAYVHESADSFDAYFPHLPRNTEQMRQTSLYTEVAYPVTEGEDGAYTMHAWSGCPAIESISWWGSVSELESGAFSECPQCAFKASSLGSVASASTSIQNGFEYHYEAVASAAEEYEKKRAELKPLTSEVKSQVNSWFDELVDAVKKAASHRIDPNPPGALGAVAFVVNTGSTATDGAFSSGFVNFQGTLGTRAAVSAATLVDEGSSEGQTAISSLLDSFTDGGAISGGLGIVLDCWSALLKAYSDGSDAIMNGVRNGLNSIPLVSASGLGTWASKKLKSLVESVGLEPAKIGSLKPVLVNSGHVISHDDSSFAQSYLEVKRNISSHPLMSTSLFSSLLTDAEKSALSAVGGLDGSIQIASIELLGSSGPKINITLPLPEAISSSASGVLEGAFDAIASTAGDWTGDAPWE